MCFRLLAALRPVGVISGEVLDALAVEHGLDIRRSAMSAGSSEYVEIAWGACACSLYSGREGRERVTGFVGVLMQRGARVQLLLAVDEVPLGVSEGAAAPVRREQFMKLGLQALPEGSAVEIVGA